MSGNSTVSVIIVIALGLVVLFLVPLVTLEERVDDVAQQDVQKIIESTVTEIANTGVLTREQYQNLENKLAATGKTYDKSIKVASLDENKGKKLAQANYTKIGENVYIEYYTTQVLAQIGIKTGSEDVNPDNYTMTLKPGDIVTINVTSQDSAAKDLKSNLFSFVSSGENVISASSSAMVTVYGSK